MPIKAEDFEKAEIISIGERNNEIDETQEWEEEFSNDEQTLLSRLKDITSAGGEDISTHLFYNARGDRRNPMGPWFVVYKSLRGDLWRLEFGDFEKAITFTHNPDPKYLDFMGRDRKILLMDVKEYDEFQDYRNKIGRGVNPIEYAVTKLGRLLKPIYCEDCLENNPWVGLCQECVDRGHVVVGK